MIRKYFEYKKIRGNVNTVLEPYGKGGWELVTAVQLSINELLYIFKREI